MHWLQQPSSDRKEKGIEQRQAQRGLGPLLRLEELGYLQGMVIIKPKFGVLCWRGKAKQHHLVRSMME